MTAAQQTKAADFWAEEAKEGRLWLHGELDYEMAMLLVSWLERCRRDKNLKEVIVDINTNGGCGPGMWAIADRIRTFDKAVTTVCSGDALSSGCVILAAGHSRKCYPHSRLLFHGALHWQGWAKSPTQAGDAEAAKRFDAAMCEFMAEVTRKPKSHWVRIVAAQEDRWITPEEALAWGIIDEIIAPLTLKKGKDRKGE